MADTLAPTKSEMGPGEANQTLERGPSRRKSSVTEIKLQELASEAIVTEISSQDARKVLWKIDLCLMPLLGFCYMLQFLDKTSLGYSALLGLLKDTKLHGTEYSWAAGVFYFGYMFWSFPTAYLAVRLPIGKYLSISILIWGVVLMCHSAIKGFAGLMVARFFLGVTEASIAPGFSLITGMFYKRKEQPLRQSIWYLGNSVANILGGIIAYGIGHADAKLAPWRLLFLVLGAVTTFWSLVMLVFLPDSPANARFLRSTKDKQISMLRSLENKTGVKSDHFRIDQMLEALRDPKAWLLVAYMFSVDLPNGGLTAFGSLIISGFGYKGLKALLYQMPSGASQLGFVVIGGVVGSYLKQSRTIIMFIFTMVSIIGMSMVYALDEQQRSARLGGYCLTVAFAANFPITLSLVSSNVAGFTKKTTVNAMVFVAYCVGNIVGPQFYLTKEAPTYPTGFRASLIGLCLAAFFIVLLRLYLMWENKRRDRVYGNVIETSDEEKLRIEAGDLTDWNIPSFRYVL